MPEPPDDAPTEEGVLSVVVGDQTQKVRARPALFLGPEIAYADRDLGRLREETSRWASTIVASKGIPTYTMTGCSYRGSVGIYARELFKGSAFRRRLIRSGFEFDDSPFVHFNEDGSFLSESFGVIRPDFLVVGDEDRDDPKRIVTSKGAMLAFVIVTYRLGAIGAAELSRLVASLEGVRALGAGHPETLADAVVAA